MKQSTRLLSILLAMVMLFGVMSIGANAALVKNQVAYDSIDNAALTAEQCADIALDLVDGLLVGMDPLDISVAKVRLDSIDHIIYDIEDLSGGLLWAIAKGLLGDAGDLDFSALDGPVQRSGGDLNVIYALLKLLSDNKSIISKVAYGLGTDNGLSIGIVGNFVNLDDINKILGDLPGYLKGILFDALLHGSYAYPNKYAETPAAASMTLDGVINTAIYNLLTTPQDKVWTDVNGTMVQSWDPDSVIVGVGNPEGIAATDVNLNSKSIFGLLDAIIQPAYNLLGVIPLNHDLKKIMMEAMGVDFVRITSANLIATLTDDMPKDIYNYFCEAAFWKYNNNYYFSDVATVNKTDAQGNALVDANGRNLTEEIRRFYVADTSKANDLYEIVNWDYAFSSASYDFAAGLTRRGSILGQLNDIVYAILNVGVNDSIKAEIVSFLDDGKGWYIEGDNTALNENILRIAKYVVSKYTSTIFGMNPDYVDVATGDALPAFVEGAKACNTLEDMVAYIALPLFKDIMPQLIIPDNFTDGLQVEQLATVVVREFLTDITPQLNFDDKIFQAGTLTSADGRKVLSDKDSDYWIDLLLGMGMNLACVYLDNVTNFNFDTDAREAEFAAHGWKGLLEVVVDWAVDYVGTASSGALADINPTALSSDRAVYAGNAFTILNTVLNKILPLSFVPGCSSENHATFDIEVLLMDKILGAVKDIDLGILLSLFGRTGATDNLLSAKGVIPSLLGLVERILQCVTGSALFPNTNSLNEAITQANLKTIVDRLLAALYTRRVDLLTNIFPIVAQFIPDWGGEQTIAPPVITIAKTLVTTNGAGSGSLAVANGSKGVWRYYYDTTENKYKQDNQYQYKVTAVTASYASGFSGALNTNIDFGNSGTINFNISGVPAPGAVVRFDINYVVVDEDGALMAGGEIFTVSEWVYIAYNNSNTELVEITSKSDITVYMYTPQFVAREQAVGLFTLDKDGNNSRNVYYFKSTSGVVRNAEITGVSNATQNGITLGKASASLNLTKKEQYNWAFTIDENAYNASVPSGTTYTWGVTAKATNSGSNVTKNLTLSIYSNAEVNAVRDAVEPEAARNRNMADYRDGDVLATKLLNSAASTEALKKETNFTATALNEDGETVTVINGATAKATYQAAFNTAMQAAYQTWITGAIFTQIEAIENLRVAANDIALCELTAEEKADLGGNDNTAAATALENEYKTVQDTIIQGKGYTDYMLYRWDRYTDARKDAEYIINLKNNAAPVTADTKFLPYNGMDQSALNKLLAKDGTYAAYINALLANYTAEQVDAKNDALAYVKATFANLSSLDIAQASNLLDRTSTRLLPREGGLTTTYIDAEIASAKAQLGEEATSTVYSAQSWNKYLATLATAKAAAAGTSQTKIFDAKYELTKARNELILIADSADYTELAELITATETVFANLDKYSNSTNKEIGLVLAAFGYAIDGVQLFPGNANDVLNTAYEAKKQGKIDDAADRLRLALSNLKFNTTAVAAPVAAPDYDVEPNTVTPNSSSYFTFTPEATTAATVAAAFEAVSYGNEIDKNTIEAVVVTNNTLAGTGTVISIYGKLGGIKVPIISYTVVVKGDVTGNALVDAIDAMLVELTANGHKTLGDDAFKRAALLDDASVGSGTVAIADVQAIGNMIVNK